MNSVNYTDPEFLAQWAREVMGHVNYGEMSERQVAEFVADASKEAPEWMKQMESPPLVFNQIWLSREELERIYPRPRAEFAAD